MRLTVAIAALSIAHVFFYVCAKFLPDGPAKQAATGIREGIIRDKPILHAAIASLKSPGLSGFIALAAGVLGAPGVLTLF